MKTIKTLAEKWGVTPWLKVRIDAEPPYLRDLVEPLCGECTIVHRGVCDLAFVAPTSAAEWKQKALRLRNAIDPDGVIWVVYPRPAFREKYRFDGSLDEMVEIVRDLGLRQMRTTMVSDELTSARFSH